MTFLQMAAYARAQPAFTRELEEASRVLRGKEAAHVWGPLAYFHPERLRRSLQAPSTPSSPNTASPPQQSTQQNDKTNKILLLAEGKLGVPDPAASERLVVDWLEDRQREPRRQRRQARRQERERLALGAAPPYSLQGPVSSWSANEDQEGKDWWCGFEQVCR